MQHTQTNSVNSFRWTSPQEEMLVKHAAAVKNIKPSAYVRESAIKQAEMDLADQTEYRLNSDQMNEFMAALERPAQAKPELQKLFSAPSIFEQ